MVKITATQIQNQIIGVDDASASKGVFTVRRGFYYRNGGSAEKLAERVLVAFPAAKIVAQGEVNKPFKGGAPLAKQSHWFVKFSL